MWINPKFLTHFNLLKEKVGWNQPSGRPSRPPVQPAERAGSEERARKERGTCRAVVGGSRARRRQRRRRQVSRGRQRQRQPKAAAVAVSGSVVGGRSAVAVSGSGSPRRQARGATVGPWLLPWLAKAVGAVCRLCAPSRLVPCRVVGGSPPSVLASAGLAASRHRHRLPSLPSLRRSRECREASSRCAPSGV